MKYVEAEYDGDADKQTLYATALQRFGIDSIKREPANNGSFVVTGKPYAERTDEEKAKINEAFEKAMPQKEQSAEKGSQEQTLDPALAQRAMIEKQGQTLH